MQPAWIVLVSPGIWVREPGVRSGGHRISGWKNVPFDDISKTTTTKAHLQAFC